MSRLFPASVPWLPEPLQLPCLLAPLPSPPSASGTSLGTSLNGAGRTWPFFLAGQASRWILQTSANRGLVPIYRDLCSPHSYGAGGGPGVPLNNGVSFFSSSRQSLTRHRGQRDTLNTVWQHPGQAPWSCWAPVQRLHMALNPREQPLPPSPTPTPGKLGDPCLSAFPSILCLPLTVPLSLALQIAELPARCTPCPTFIILVG